MLAGYRWTAPDEYFWTPDRYFEAFKTMTPELLREIRAKTFGCFYDLSLDDQCSLLGVKYCRKHPADMQVTCSDRALTSIDSVERFAFDFFRNQGWTGDTFEGFAILLLLFKLRRNLEAQDIKLHNYYYRSLSKSHFPNNIYKRDGIDPDESKIIDWEVEFILQDRGRQATYEQWHKLHKSFTIARNVTPEKFSIESFFAVCDGLTSSVLSRITHLMVMGYLGAGWPDLTLQRNKELSFVEVKQGSDKFTHRQAYWIRNFAVPLGLDFTVLHVTPSLKVGLRRLLKD